MKKKLKIETIYAGVAYRCNFYITYTYAGTEVDIKVHLPMNL